MFTHREIGLGSYLSICWVTRQLLSFVLDLWERSQPEAYETVALNYGTCFSVTVFLTNRNDLCPQRGEKSSADWKPAKHRKLNCRQGCYDCLTGSLATSSPYPYSKSPFLHPRKDRSFTHKLNSSHYTAENLKYYL